MRVAALALGALLSASGVRADCGDPPWSVVQRAMEGGDHRTLGALIGTGRVSLIMDAIPPGDYTAPQASRLLADFFRRTTERRLSFRSCGRSGETQWAEADLVYRWARSDSPRQERLLLETCREGDEARLCGVRSASPAGRDVPP